MACLTSAIEPLRAANEIAGEQAFSWRLISETGTRVRSSAEVSFDPDLALEAVEDLDYLFLLSSPQGSFENPRASDGHLRRLARHGVKMGGISGGVFPLARSGLLSGYECSVHWCYEAAFAAEFPDHEMTGEVINIDRNRYTVSGAAAAFDLMLHLIEEELGDDVTTEVACWFQHPLVRGQGVRQKIPTVRKQSTSDMLPPIVAQAVEIFASHIEDPIGVYDVAQIIGVSARQLERSFKQATEQSPSHYYRSLRMNAARQLVLYSKDSMTEIANAVGYASATPMVRHYKESFGLSPNEDRKTINMFRVENNRSIPST
ncbi:GlxA family transcriptional regulator [Sulfitobacter aestuarii]|uniref:GlxA family transcriptional regulator n=1 Tax=Sulfitobacter aestuarii TaxID=2161676 RepID=A0ABW5U1F9_9RHOB